MRQRLLIAVTAPETLVFILRHQPRYLSQFFDVFLVTSPGPETERIREEGVPLYMVPMERGISPFKDLVSLLRMLALLRELRPDIIHSYTPKAGLLCMVAAKICRVPLRVHTFTGLIFPTAQGWRQKLLIAMDRLLCRCATHIVPESLGVKNHLQDFRITAKPLHVIGYGNIAGVDVEYFSPTVIGLNEAVKNLRAQYQIEATDFVYVFVGRLSQDNGISELLAAFEQLPNNTRLLLVGGLDKRDPIRAEVQQLVHEHLRVHALGFQYDIRPALLAADVLVLPSYHEGFPNAVLQAGAMELPVVATDISGCNEVIEPGMNGWLVPPYNIPALVTALSAALNTPKECLHIMGHAARERIVQRFERQQHWQRMVAFYRALLPVQGQEQKSILIVAGFAESILNFRRELICSLQSKGLNIHLAIPVSPSNTALMQHFVELGWQVHEILLQRSGTDLLGDLRALWALWRLMRQIQPDVVLGYTIKPVVYGTLTAWLAGVPRRYALITGLGYAFTGHLSGLRRMVNVLAQCLYRLTLRRAHKVFFQNSDDEALFRHLDLLHLGVPSVVVHGSGVNLVNFTVAPLPLGPPRFLLIARLLGDKGVREYVQAAQCLRRVHPTTQFALAGWIDESPDAIAQSELDAWVEQGDIEYLGYLQDVCPAIARCSVYVLPSYREGTPRSVLEAMAMGRPIITTNAPGCRETVVDGENGFLVPVKSVDALVQAMDRFVVDPLLAVRMGQRSRQLAEEKYDVQKVNAVMLKEMGIT